jgi:hypothetical protein
MRFRPVIYPTLLIYELLRLMLVLCTVGLMSSAVTLSLLWYALIPLLCVVPVLVFMLMLDEARYTLWLPLASLIKALGLPALAVYLGILTPDVIRFRGSEGSSVLVLFGLTLALILGDTFSGLYYYRRNRTLCR